MKEFKDYLFASVVFPPKKGKLNQVVETGESFLARALEFLQNNKAKAEEENKKDKRFAELQTYSKWTAYGFGLSIWPLGILGILSLTGALSLGAIPAFALSGVVLISILSFVIANVENWVDIFKAQDEDAMKLPSKRFVASLAAFGVNFAAGLALLPPFSKLISEELINPQHDTDVDGEAQPLISKSTAKNTTTQGASPQMRFWSFLSKQAVEKEANASKNTLTEESRIERRKDFRKKIDEIREKRGIKQK